MRYEDRRDAASALIERLQAYREQLDVLVLGLPRGGVPVAATVAHALGAELDAMVVRKIGFPGRRELAMGAVAMGGVREINREVVQLVEPGVFEAAAKREGEEVARRVKSYRGDRPLPKIRGRTVILVDDGLATGSTMKAAIRAVKAQDPKEVIVTVPVAPDSTIAELRAEVDEVICPYVPSFFLAISQFYEDFRQVEDSEVRALLMRAWRRTNAGVRAVREQEVRIAAGGASLDGSLVIPEDAGGIVLFAHGSGSSRHSPRNRFVAHVLHDSGLATLLFDLLTIEEEAVDVRTREHRFDIPLLAERLVSAIDWVVAEGLAEGRAIGLFGASTGAAAALVAAARRKEAVKAVVSRGGRPDLAGDVLGEVQAPTLLIVGGWDSTVVELNREAASKMSAERRIEIVPGATHLFEEPGKLERAASLAADWFANHLLGATRR